MTFPVNEQNVSVMRIDINALSLSLDLNIFQQDECSCSKLGMEVELLDKSLAQSRSNRYLLVLAANMLLFCTVRIIVVLAIRLTSDFWLQSVQNLR